MNNIVKLSLWEVLQNEHFITQMKGLHKVGKYELIHIALWPAHKKLPIVCPELLRTQKDICNTVKIIMENTKFSVLSQNEKKESVVQSLFEANKNGYVDDETRSEIYGYLMNPNQRSIEIMTKEVFNKITETNFEKFRSIICWLISLPESTFSEELFEKFQLIKPFDRDSKNGRYKELDKFSNMFKLISKKGYRNSGNRDFNDYFKVNKWNKQNVNNILNNVSNYFINADLEQAYNIEIVGGVIGEFSELNDIMQYCSQENITKYPGSVMTCVAHAYPRFKEQKMLLILNDILTSTRGKIKFNVQDIIEHLVPKDQIINIEKIEEKIVEKIEEKIVEKKENPLIGSMSSLKTLNSLSDTPSYYNKELYPEELEDVGYTMRSDYIAKYDQSIVCEALITNSILSVYSDIGLSSFKLLLESLLENGLDKKTLDLTVKSKMTEIYQNWMEDNPRGAKTIKNIFEDVCKY